MITIRIRILCFIISLMGWGCENSSTQDLANSNSYDLIPLPQKMIPHAGEFKIIASTKLLFEKGAQKVAQQFAELIKEHVGIELAQESAAVLYSDVNNVIVFQISEKIPEVEGYRLEVNEARVLVQAKNANGLFYGMQTLRQLLPVDFEQKNNAFKRQLVVPAVSIADAPRFPYRGLHLDVARHFFDVKTVKAYIDQLAFHKLNYFHWHLTDDQGWRVEIKQFPKLTEVSAFRNGTLIGHYNDQPHQFDNKKYGGFYTQEEIREVVQYAADRYITIIPEIEMPGHAQAVLAAYPELACTDEKFEVLQKWGVSDNVFCPTEATFEFLEKVIDEVMDLFPGKYIHIGGDECPKVKWEESAFCQQLMHRENLGDAHELQSYFIQRMEKYINKKGRQIIGWDEILEGGLAPNATVMSWRGIEGGIQAAKEKHDVIMTPTSHCYFDYYQSDHPDEPLAIGGFVPLKKIYSFEPIPEELSQEEAKFILGAQANLWTEYIATEEKLEYMTFPRASALAEVVWSNKDARNFENFIERLTPHLQRLEHQGIKAANHLYELESSIQPVDGKVVVNWKALSKNADIFYTTDGSTPTRDQLNYQDQLIIDKDATIIAQAFLKNNKVGRPWKQSIKMHKAAGKKIELINAPHPKYSGDGNGSVINGVLGADERYGDKEWLGFGDGEHFEALIDLGKTEEMKTIDFRFFKGEGQWIYLPKSIVVSIGDDPNNLKEVTRAGQVTGDTKVVQELLNFTPTAGRYLKVIVNNYGTIPAGAQGAGNLAWLFVDEIQVR